MVQDLRELLQKRIKSFWLDQAEPEFHPNQYDNLRFYRGNGEEVALLYPIIIRSLYEGLKSAGERR